LLFRKFLRFSFGDAEGRFVHAGLLEVLVFVQVTVDLELVRT